MKLKSCSLAGIPSLLLTALLSLVLLLTIPIAAQQLTASNWGKNSLGVELATHEGPRQHTSGGTMLMYNLLGRGFPSEVPYDLWVWSEGKQPQKLMQGVSFDKRGILVCSGNPGFCAGAGPDDPVNIQAKASPGERKRFAVISPDGKIAGFAEAIPFPR